MNRISLYKLSIVAALTLLPVVSGYSQPAEGTAIAVAPARVPQYMVEDNPEQLTRLMDEIREQIREDGRLQLVDADQVSQTAQQLGYTSPSGAFALDQLLTIGNKVDAGLVLGIEINGENRTLSYYEIRVASMEKEQVEVRHVGQGRKRGEVPVSGIKSSIQRMLDELLNERGTLNINTDPPNSAVFINGRSVGFAPLTVLRPSDFSDTLLAKRYGYNDREKVVRLKPDQKLNVLLRLHPEKKTERRTTPPLHLFALAGTAIDQGSSTLDSRISWGQGNVYGIKADAGSIWRIGLGFFVYNDMLNNVEQELINNAGAISDPEAYASIIHSNLFYYAASNPISPYLGLGLTAMQRTIDVKYDGSSETRDAEFEAGWMFVVGIESRIYRMVRAQVELLHVRTLFQNDAWRSSEDSEMEAALWENAFQSFETFTVLRGGIGITF